MHLIYLILKWFSKDDLLRVRKLITDILSKKLSRDEQSKLFWDDNGYLGNLHVPPANPSKDDLKHYKNYLIQGGENKKVLLLGSTPLLRNLLTELNFQKYIIADFSFATIENSSRILNKLGKDINIENEMWLKSDWLGMPLEQSFFDNIVGDLVFTQIEPSKQLLFTKKISSLLKENGSFVVRMYICNNVTDELDPQEIIKDFLNSKTFENTAEQRFTLLYRLRDRLREKRTQSTSPYVIINNLLKYKTLDEKKLNFLKSLVKMVSKRAELGLPFVTQTREEIMDIISPEFILEEKITSNDYSSEFFPIYILRKKNKLRLPLL